MAHFVQDTGPSRLKFQRNELMLGIKLPLKKTQVLRKTGNMLKLYSFRSGLTICNLLL